MEVINRHQTELYGSFAKSEGMKHLERYLTYLQEFENRKKIRILDIGGATGHLAYLLKKYYEHNGAEVYVVDSTSYDTWSESGFGNDVHFICDSVENLKDLFEDNTFDLIFANRVFHHFVQSSWQRSLKGIDECMQTIHSLLKVDGCFCIMDHFYNGALIDSGSSFLVYTFTSIHNPLIAKLVKKMGAESAGVGTCFLSEQMWKHKLGKSGFDIIHIERTIPDKMTLAKRILMFKNASRDNLIIAVPKMDNRI